MMKQAIIDDVNEWKHLEGEEGKKAMKKLRMLYGHLHMWNMKMAEVNQTDTDKVDKPMPFKDINQKSDDDFVYF